MKHPLNLLIHVPLREKRDFKQMLVGFKHALCVRQVGKVLSYDLLPSFKPRKGQEHQLVGHVAEQLRQGWTLVAWDVDRLMLELQQVVEGVSIGRPRVRLLLMKLGSSFQAPTTSRSWMQSSSRDCRMATMSLWSLRERTSTTTRYRLASVGG